MAHRRPIEISLPFRVDINGSIAVTDDPVQIARQHLVTLITTELNERVMRPLYGVGLSRYLFEPDDAAVLTELEALVSDAVARWEPGIRLVSMTPVSGVGTDSIVGLNINFMLANVEQTGGGIHTAYVDVGGTVMEVLSSG